MTDTPLSSILLVLLASLIGSFGAVFLKMGAARGEGGLLAMLNMKLAAGIALFVGSSVPFIMGIKHGELSVLYPMVSLGYVWTLFWSRLFFGEPITRGKIGALGLILAGIVCIGVGGRAASSRHTEVSIRGDQFFINGEPTYSGRNWQGLKIEGLLMNVRAVQGIFDDLNHATRSRWAYKDTGKWDANRNTREFVAALAEWRGNGVLAFTINLQGGSPEGYSKGQPWENTAFDAAGELRPAYMSRLAKVLDRADELGMVAIVGYFYFGQDERLKDEAAVKRAVKNATGWLLDQGYRNVLVEIDNECNVKYDHAILKADRVHELIDAAKKIERGGRHLPVSTSYGGGTPAGADVVKASDFILLHGNGADDPQRIHKMIRETRAVSSWHTMPVVVNEDDHFRFGDADNHYKAALEEYASWGYFDPRGYQCPPVNWGSDTERKRQFFAKVKEVTGL